MLYLSLLGGFHVFEVFLWFKIGLGIFFWGGVFKVVFRDFEGVSRVFMVVS